MKIVFFSKNSIALAICRVGDGADGIKKLSFPLACFFGTTTKECPQKMSLGVARSPHG